MKIYNTLSRRKETLAKKVNLFVCGITAYDFAHLGHARTYIAFDSFVKYLRHKKYKVAYVQNITDIEDKIIKRAKEKSIKPEKLSLLFEKEYLKDMKILKVDSVTKYARATSHIKEIISQIKRLKDKGYGYQTKDGIYYDITKFKNYGKLSKRTALQAQDAVSRIDEDKNKRNKGDFCLWKFSKKGEPKWPSPFGPGRPGWHIEDTAITEKFFGPQYDIHGGARDLIFPHHEAEISQMEAISGKSPLAKHWMHTGFLTVNKEKMSKSLKNFITIQDFLKKHSPQCLRFIMLKALWRSPIDYSEKTALEAETGIKKIEDFLRRLKDIKGKAKNSNILKKTRIFYKYLDGDFNTPKAFGEMFDIIKKANKLIDKRLIGRKEASDIYKFFEEINTIFEIIDFENIKEKKIPDNITRIKKEIDKLRKEKKYKESDKKRKELEQLGYTVRNTEKGTIVMEKPAH